MRQNDAAEKLGCAFSVVVDKCYDHDTGYDEGELKKVREFIKDGGLEDKKLRLTERSLGNLERKPEDEALRRDMCIDKPYCRIRHV